MKRPAKKAKWVTCKRGHRFQRSSDCPVCPKCWPGYYKKLNTDLPNALAAPAARALLNARTTKLSQVAKRTESELLELHGMGSKALGQLKTALRKRGLTFARKQVPTPKTKPYTHYHNDGSLWAKGHLAQGIMEGYWEWFRKDGTKMRSGSFKHGEQVGEWITYDQRGKIYKKTIKK